MAAPFGGGCLCGAVRYECSAEPIVVAHCHCRDCQQTSGGSMATVALVPKPAFKLVKGESKSYSVTAESGNANTRHFCDNCGSPLFTEIEAAPALWLIKAASLDDPSWLKPAMHIWCESAQPWDKMADDLPKLPKNPPLG